MNDTIGMIQADEELLSYEISDEALETAGNAGKENAYTLGACSGLSVCPG
jgi:proteasome assembly chaperone (PAC2) family protein